MDVRRDTLRGSIDALFSSASEEWETPQEFFNELDKEFHFTLDAAATKENAKCDRFFTKADNSLEQHWDGNVWLNPPYGRGLKKWVHKASYSAGNGADVIVMLIPARTDTSYWHDCIFPYAAEIRFLSGRLKFGQSKNSAPFPSAVIVFDKKKKKRKVLP